MNSGITRDWRHAATYNLVISGDNILPEGPDEQLYECVIDTIFTLSGVRIRGGDICSH